MEITYDSCYVGRSPVGVLDLETSDSVDRRRVVGTQSDYDETAIANYHCREIESGVFECERATRDDEHRGNTVSRWLKGLADAYHHQVCRMQRGTQLR